MTKRRLLEQLSVLYGPSVAAETLPRLMSLLAGRQRPPRHGDLTEADALLTAYGDHVSDHTQPGLAALENLLRNQLGGVVTGLHLLPFHTATSDGGFAVSDFSAVDPSLGTWDDIDRLSREHRLMVDCVLNHVSSEHPWFKAFLAGDERYADHFIRRNRGDDSSQTMRPTTSPLFHTFDGEEGPVEVWTTFGPDQPDLNYRSPAVLVDVVRSLLSYVEHGAAILRLAAVTGLWKEAGTSSFSRPETHAIVRLVRAVTDAVDPSVIVLADADTSDSDTARYFGDGADEAHVVSQLALPPLLLHTLHTGNSTHLSAWAASREMPGEGCTFYNVTATHDGIGLLPAKGVLSQADVEALVTSCVASGGEVSTHVTADGPEPYEINLTYFDAVTAPTEPLDDAINRFLVTQAIMLALPGVPGIYLPSLFGMSSARDVSVPRDANRARFDAHELETELRDPWSKSARVFSRYSELLQVRCNEPAFHPHGSHRVRMLGSEIFAIERVSPNRRRRVLALHNVTARKVRVPIVWLTDQTDLISGQPVSGIFELDPYQVAWIRLRP